MNIHELKTWPNYFEDLMSGLKDFEIRYNDRDFQVGEKIICKEYDPETKKLTGREIPFRIKYIVKWNDNELISRALKINYCVLGLGR